MSGEAKRVIVIGCGDVGSRIALREQALGATVVGSFHRQGRDVELRDAGIAATRLDLDSVDQGVAQVFEDAQIYYLVPPGKTEPVDSRARRLLELLGEQRPRGIVMISQAASFQFPSTPPALANLA